MIEKRLINNRGFTLIELITVIIVLGILSVFTFSFIEHAVKTYAIGNKQRVLYQEASYIMERITREIRDANSVLLPSAGRLRLARSNITGSIIMDPSSIIDFYKSGNSLIRNSDIERVMGTNVDQFIPSISGDCSTSICIVSISLTLTDLNIPIDEPSARSVTLRSSVAPKNLIFGYSGRSFNGDYEDVIQ